MKKVYIRAGMNPLTPVCIDDAIYRDLYGMNTGNLIYQYSVFRTLMCRDTEFDTRWIGQVYDSPGGVEQLGETCSSVVIPLANAFRIGFGLTRITDMIRRLKIPCVIVGCGLQADSAADIREGFPFDEDVKDLIKAALDKSAMVGVRGEFTGEYLKKLGFVPERHYTVIGCPGMFMNGPVLPKPTVTPITPQTRFSINTRDVQPASLNRLMARTAKEYPDHHIVLQKKNELFMLAYNVSLRHTASRDRTGYYPFNQRHRDVRNGRVLAFTQARAWFDYMADIDYSFGSRIHGNLAAVINGVPAFVFTSDTRTEELCRYGNIQYMPVERLKDGADIRDIIERADFDSVSRGYEQRFDHFVDFLNQNGLDHIYKQIRNPQSIPFDEAMKGVAVGGRVEPGCVPRSVAKARRRDCYIARMKKVLKIK